MQKTIETVYSFPIRAHHVEVVYLEYEGGGECWEFRVFENGQELHQSENGYGNPYSAASDGFKWIVENGY